MGYAQKSGTRTAEWVPLVIGSRGKTWYLLAAPITEHTDASDPERVRTLRVDRIVELQVLQRTGTPPAGYDVRAAWAQMVNRVEQIRGAARARIRVAAHAIAAFCDYFGAQATRIDDSDEVDVGAQNERALAEQLAGWTDAIQVLGPASVRAELHRLGERIIAANSAPD